MKAATAKKGIKKKVRTTHLPPIRRWPQTTGSSRHKRVVVVWFSSDHLSLTCVLTLVPPRPSLTPSAAVHYASRSGARDVPETNSTTPFSSIRRQRCVMRACCRSLNRCVLVRCIFRLSLVCVFACACELCACVCVPASSTDYCGSVCIF